jgi:hypothetical protein
MIMIQVSLCSYEHELHNACSIMVIAVKLIEIWPLD